MYSFQERGKELKLTSGEFRKYMTVFIYIGIVRMKNARSYWEQLTAVPQITSLFSRDRFLEIARNLNFLTVTDEEKKNKISAWCVEK